MKNLRRRRNGSVGFTLVEVALALMVIAIGLMAVFGTFTTGLDADKLAFDDTMAAIFAEDVFSALLSIVVTTRWDRIDKIEIPPAATDQWRFVSSLIVRPTDQWRTNSYFFDGAKRGFPESTIAEYSMRYKLIIDDIQGMPLAYARLEVLPGAYGPTDRVKRFYLEFANMKPRVE